MSGWSESEERFEIQPSDFTVTRPEASAEEICEAVDHETRSAGAGFHSGSNYFYEKLGFKVGLFFEGERKIYHSKK